MRRAQVLWLCAAAIAAAPAPAAADDDGFLGARRLALAIDDCPPRPTVADAARAERFTEHYNRGVVLYVQGDYDGAIVELVAAHCLIAKPSLLKDIAQAYERSVRYEHAIAYLERFVVDTDDAVEQRNAGSRLQVLAGLRSQIRVATEPPEAAVTVRNADGVRGTATANTEDVIELPAGRYTMTVERPNFEPIEVELEVGVGRPYSYSYRLTPRRGRLRIQTVPGDARILVDDRVVGLGSFDGEVDLGPHKIEVDQRGWLPVSQTIEVQAQGVAEASIQLDRPPSTARWLAVTGAAALGGYVVTSAGLVAESDDGTLGGGAVAGIVGGALAGYLFIPSDIRQGTASLLMTATTAGLLDGLQLGAALSEDERVVSSIALGGAAVGAGTAAWVLGAYDVSDGDAALVNTGLLWGSVSGVLFTQVFSGGDRTELALTAAGTNLGLLTGAVMARRYDLSRRRVIYIDLAGAAGLVAGLAVQNGLQSSGEGANSDESRSHFTLAGMAIGLGLGVFLTRDYDAPKLRVRPQVAPLTDPAGGRGLMVGVAGAL